MSPLPRLIAIAAIPAWLGISAQSAAAQDFSDRWSIIPKAHAEPAPEPPAENSPVAPPAVSPPAPSPEASTAGRSFNRVFSGKASFYSYSKGKTASGARFDRDAMTAAHRSLPFGTKVRVTDVASSKSVVVRISDRGPFIAGRVLDLSLAAARTLGITDRGVAQVRVEVL
jgi:rare lipoprotein A